MLGNTISLDIGTTSVPELVVLNSVEAGLPYTYEYRALIDDKKYTCIIRHTTEKTKVNNLSMERHQVLVRVEEAPTDIYPQGRMSESYLILRAPSNMAVDDARKTAFAVATHVPTILPAFIAWNG